MQFPIHPSTFPPIVFSWLFNFVKTDTEWIIFLKFVSFNRTTKFMVAAWLDGCLPFHTGYFTLPQSELILPCVWMALKLSHWHWATAKQDKNSLITKWLLISCERIFSWPAGIFNNINLLLLPFFVWLHTETVQITASSRSLMFTSHLWMYFSLAATKRTAWWVM